VIFELQRLRFHFVAKRAIHFPLSKPANVLRGAFGAALRRMTDDAAYSQIFAPASIDGPSGFAAAPRPYVFRARHLDARTVAAGEPFDFEVNLFDLRAKIVEDLTSAVSELPHAEIQQIDRERQSVDLESHGDRVTRLRVEFLTPTELKSGDRLAARPEFPILFARIRDRVSTLRDLYGPGPLPIDFRVMGERATEVRLAHCDIRTVEVTRRSGSTGQTHSIGGFVGSAEYEGELAEFLPYLEAARWTGVGRQTVWGKGEISLTHPPAFSDFSRR
jgi:hypothetical protein